MLSLNRNEKVTGGKYGTKITKKTFNDTRRDVQLEPCAALNVQSSQQPPRLT